ncbi:hypothetical protein DFP72DRAFT_1067819 [Ephemerocybe angulata]|uniref:Uncharacterized protein n=1 Tax=Ephemerocybe angulata TaxID=980116 RepID=A0A8H6M556_9AGAR|nr:hypothetical protein DFP72DRAFT_1067819 [Tulosesus angulatus]
MTTRRKTPEGEEESDSASDNGSASHEAFPLPSSSPNHLLSPIPNNNANLYTSAPYWTNNTNGGIGEGEETPDLTDPGTLLTGFNPSSTPSQLPNRSHRTHHHHPHLPRELFPSHPTNRATDTERKVEGEGRGSRSRNRRRPKRDKNEVGEEDKEVLKSLQSATIMNGGKDKEEGRTTVWDVLQQLQWGGGKERGRDGEDERSDMGSVMMYSPLIPGKKDIVELAEVAPVG